MAGELETTQTFVDGEQVTSTKLNDIIAQASFTADAVTGTTLTVTGGKLKVGTITSSELGSDSVTTAAIADGQVSFSKMDTDAVATKSETQNGVASKLVSAESLRDCALVPQAFTNCSISSASRTLGNNYRFSSATKLSTTKTRLTFATAQTDTGYCVFGMVVSTDGSGSGTLVVSNLTTTTFDVTHPAEGAPYVQIHLMVFNL